MVHVKDSDTESELVCRVMFSVYLQTMKRCAANTGLSPWVCIVCMYIISVCARGGVLQMLKMIKPVLFNTALYSNNTVNVCVLSSLSKYTADAALLSNCASGW